MPGLKVNYPEKFIEWALRNGLPLLPADEANERVLQLTYENMVLQAQLDAMKIKEAEND